jgi:bifunctional non-homologous end joining protein LigD
MAARGGKLAEYNAKRDFARTREPKGKTAKARRNALSFLVQKHAARRLHYDLRLEWDGVLLSWAVTRGPSDDPSEKRLAVRTEDHPLSYGTFEGTIPQGEYGGGTVMMWDRGAWEPLHDPAEGLKAGMLHFRIDGQRMKGGWALIRMRGRAGARERRENWLLVKERDEAATDAPNRLTEAYTTSIATGRSMDAIARDEASPVWHSTDAAPAPAPAEAPRPSRRSGARPKFRKPQLATLVDEAPRGDDWLHETKFDGYRCLVALGRGGERLYTRSGLDWTARFGALAGAFDALSCASALIDGEVMARRQGGGSAFNALQAALAERKPLTFYAFDLLSLDGEDLASLPQIERKARLERLLAGRESEALRFSQHVVGHGAEAHAHACKAGGEGIVSKRLDAPYRSARTRSWVKIKCTRRQEFVVGGWSPSAKKGRPFSSLLLGQFEGGKLRYRGRVGAGFDQASLAMLARALEPLTRATSPFAEMPRDQARHARWVTPRLVVEVDFTEITDEGNIRHGVFLGLRQDRAPETVAPERAEKMAASKPAAGKDRDPQVAGIRISSGDREMFPGAGLTKLDVARYYAEMGERMLQAAGRRPVSLVRCPGGIDGTCFFQKHANQGFPKQLKEVDVEEKDGTVEQYLYAATPAGLVAAAQMGTIEFHIWGARIDRLDRPDRLVFDLDPDEGLDFAATRAAAVEVRDLLAGIGLASSPILTGGKGVHVALPLRRTISWDTLKAFARTVATLLAQAYPDRYVATMSKARRRGRIFVDYLRNERGATAIAPYSVRARPGATVAAPVTWDELAALDGAHVFTIRNAAERLSQPCPSAAVAPQSITGATVEALGKAFR